MSTFPDAAVLILAGGSSRRFGSDKAFARRNGETFLGSIWKTVEGLTPSTLLLTRRGVPKGSYLSEAPGARVVPDASESGGPVVAVREAMKRVQSRFVLVVSCDAPGLRRDLCERLIAAAEKAGRPAVARDASGPLFALFAAPSAVLKERLGAAERLEDLLTDAVPVKTAVKDLNVNEPAAP